MIVAGSTEPRSPHELDPARGHPLGRLRFPRASVTGLTISSRRESASCDLPLRRSSAIHESTGIPKKLAEFLIEFAVAVQKHAIYPQGHPQLAARSGQVRAPTRWAAQR